MSRPAISYQQPATRTTAYSALAKKHPCIRVLPQVRVCYLFRPAPILNPSLLPQLCQLFTANRDNCFYISLSNRATLWGPRASVLLSMSRAGTQKAFVGAGFFVLVFSFHVSARLHASIESLFLRLQNGEGTVARSCREYFIYWISFRSYVFPCHPKV